VIVLLDHSPAEEAQLGSEYLAGRKIDARQIKSLVNIDGGLGGDRMTRIRDGNIQSRFNKVEVY
jgi:hypothetical protein